MTYPFEKLSYSLRQRLCRLFDPAETYAFQIAAPNFIGFQPIQKFQQVSDARFLIYKNNILQKLDSSSVEYSTPTNSEAIPLYYVSNLLSMVKFTPDIKLSAVFGGFRLAPKHVYFYDCVLDETLIQSFVHAIINPIQHVHFYPCTFTSENAAKMLCNSPAFKALEDFTLKEPMFPSATWWIEALGEAGCTSFKSFHIHFASLSVLEIDKNIFLKFFKAQRNDFRMVITMSWQTKMHRAFKRVKKLLNEHFENCDFADYSQKAKGVEIYYGRQAWYYILRAD
uniref:DUF3822 family protein n=1 Tax=Panagrellus redivivus TaxID=6233 RepID=A0A7E4VZH0_PANRE